MSQPVFFDTHAHLDYSEFRPDFDGVLERARNAGIGKIISIGTNLESSRRAVALAEKHPMIYAAVGWHPANALEAPADIRPELRELARHPRTVAIGETGLDYYRLPSSQGGSAEDDEKYKQKQTELFQQQLEVAAGAGLNCVIHQRGECFTQTMTILKPWSSRVRGVFHCFAGTAATVQEILAINSLVSFTGILTFKNGQNVRDALAVTPAGKFMLETDCPYLAPVPYRGKRCEPAFVKEISEVAAPVKNCSLEELSASTCRTAREFFPKLGE
jgi:TatD DNase family protein